MLDVRNSADTGLDVGVLLDRLREIEERLIPTGLHVLDQPGDQADAIALAAEYHPPAVVDALRSGLQQATEIDAVVRALNGRYLQPSSGGDVVRNPALAPTGRNLHGLNPALVPNGPALARAKRTAELLVERYLAEEGAYPESVGMVLWGTDNLKTDGEAIGQVLALLGVEPLVDDLGRVHDVRLVPLTDLGRPRIDVVITASGIFRDLFANHLELLDSAFQLAANADEPLDRNFVRAHALATAAELEVPLEHAAVRIFSNAPGAYGSNVNFAIETRAWKDERELSEVFLRRKSFVYGRGASGQDGSQLLERALSTVDVAFQNVDSLEFGVTDIDHYVEYLGAMTSSVRHLRGQQPRAYLADFVMPDGKVRSVEEMVALETRTKSLNPRWYEGMLAHGYEGAREIENHVTNTFGWSATCHAVPDWVYDKLAATYALDEDMLSRLRDANPHAAAGLVARLLEAEFRGYWRPAPETADRLKAEYLRLEALTEGS